MRFVAQRSSITPRASCFSPVAMTMSGRAASMASRSAGHALAKLIGRLTAWMLTRTSASGSSKSPATAPSPCSASARGTSTAGLTSTSGYRSKPEITTLNCCMTSSLAGPQRYSVDAMRSAIGRSSCVVIFMLVSDPETIATGSSGR